MGELREDPHDRVALFLIAHLPVVSRSALLSLAFASLAYFVLEAIEAVGLLLDRFWVERLIVVEAGCSCHSRSMSSPTASLYSRLQP